ncbi:MAG TPA: glycosyltransferase family A protein [Thermomicrobiales bacterium]|nr:glycosyltransferase family A protein [Thermomicrobiales bacterium]
MSDRHASVPPRVSVVMPTFKQARFLRRAFDSLLTQSLTDWELVVVDDGSPDDTQAILAPFLDDSRIRGIRFDTNQGLGCALNAGLDATSGSLVAYLPSDDVWYRDHLASLADLFTSRPDLVLAYSGIRHHYNRSTPDQIDGEPLQLVQTMHRRTTDRWLERSELTTDDLERMLWSRLRARGPVAGTSLVTCEWVDHPGQRHKLLREPIGGINPYRLYCNVREPMRFHSTEGNFIDEGERFARYRERPDTPMANGGLKILLVGELAYNPERVLALEERGHRLFGLWMPNPYWYNYVGPLPFGHVQDLDPATWQDDVRRIQPDVIYALLNWQAVPFARSVLAQNPGVPFVWHFKEGPFICLEHGCWEELIDLCTGADGFIVSSPEMLEWFDTVLPALSGTMPTLSLDGDLPKREWFDAAPSERISSRDGEIHTVVPGRPIGLHPETVAELGAEGVHLHFYGDFTHGQWKAWIERTRGLAPRHLHLHANVDQNRWVSEFSQYDAGWLHGFTSHNRGDIRRADWDDLNYPARIATLAAAGLPMIQKNNSGARVAIQTLGRERDLSVFYSSIPDLASQLRETDRIEWIRDSVWRQRDHFTFDAHADELIAFFRTVIATASSRCGRSVAAPTAPHPNGQTGTSHGTVGMPQLEATPRS